MTDSPGRVDLTVAHLAELGAVEVVSAHRMRTPVERQLRDDYSLRLVERGFGRFTLRRGISPGTLTADVTSPRLLIVEPGDVISSRPISAEGWTVRRLCFPPALWSAVDVDAPAAPPSFREPRLSDADVVRLFLRAHSALERDSSPLAQSELLTRLLCVARRRGNGASQPAARRERRAVKRAREYLRARLTEPVTLADVARHVGLSPFYLLATFREATGLPIHQYHIHLRVAHACGLLARGASPALAAASSGFADRSHLGRHFKRLVGVTPAAYAAAWKSGPGRRDAGAAEE